MISEKLMGQTALNKYLWSIVDHISIFLIWIGIAFYPDSMYAYELNYQYFPKFCNFSPYFMLIFNSKLLYSIFCLLFIFDSTLL